MADKDSKTNDKNNDRKLWEDYTHDIKPLKSKKLEKLQVSDSQEAKREKDNSIPPPKKTVVYAKKEVGVPDPFQQSPDRRTKEKLRRGQFKVEAKRDLHGMNRQDAYDNLVSFIQSSYLARKKCVLVITGKGGWQSADELLVDKKPGILRQSLPEWLSDSDLSPYVLSWQKAKPKDGGDGAFYVLLKRKK